MTREPSHDAGDLGTVLRQDLDRLAAHAPVPSAAAVWLRAERRARLDALKQAERPIWFAERTALVGAGVVIGWAGTLAQGWLNAHDVAALFSAPGMTEPLFLGVPAMTLGLVVFVGLVLIAGVLAVRSAD